MGIAIMPKGILKKPTQMDNKFIKDELSLFEVDFLKSNEVGKALKAQLEFEIGKIKNNTESINGRIYENNELIYEGEYLKGVGSNSKRWFAHGYGKSYYNNGVLEYEGNFVYGHPQGYGKYYYTNGQLRWSGTFEAAVGMRRLELWASSLGYVDRKGRISYGKAYSLDGELLHYGEFDYLGRPKK